jgi:hypothetical protein
MAVIAGMAGMTGNAGITGITGITGVAGIGRGWAAAGNASAARNIDEKSQALLFMMVSL